MECKRQDALAEETFDEIASLFELEHAFPVTFIKEEEKDERGFWRRLWDSIKARLRPRGRGVPKVHDQQGDDSPSGSQSGSGHDAD